MGHGYVPESRIEIDRLIDAAVAKGREGSAVAIDRRTDGTPTTD